MRHEKTFIYLNTAEINGREIVKVGISKDPEKRVSAFNCGIWYRARGGYCPEVKFVRRCTAIAKSRIHAKAVETAFKRKNKEMLLSGFGSEVFDMHLKKAVNILNEVIDAVV